MSADIRTEVAIVGGGIAGLTTAFLLARRGIDVRVLEAQARPGGNIRSEPRAGYLCEWGPNGFLDHEPATLRLVDALGLTSALAPASAVFATRYLVRDGRLRALPAKPPQFLVSDVLSLPGRLRVLLEWMQPARRDDGDESVFDFAARRIGQEAAEVLVDAMVTGVYAGDSRRLSLPSAFPKMRAMETRHGGLFRALLALRRERRAGAKAGSPMGPAGTLTSFGGGLETLVSALAAALGERLHLATKATAITATDTGLRLETSAGSVHAHTLIVATPSWAAAPLVHTLDSEIASELAAMPHAPVAVACLGYAESDLEGVPRGFGFLVPGRERLPILGTLFDSWVFPNRSPGGKVLWRAMIGGARDPRAVEENDAALIDRALSTYARVLGLRATPEMTHVVRYPRGIPQYEVGHGTRLARLEALLVRHPRLRLSGNSYRGIAMNPCIQEAEATAAALGQA